MLNGTKPGSPGPSVSSEDEPPQLSYSAQRHRGGDRCRPPNGEYTMKKTRIALIVVLVIVIASMAGTTRILAQSALGIADQRLSPGSLSFLKNGLEHFPAAFWGIVRTSSPDLKDFDSIRVDGKWEVDIEHSDEFFVELRIRTRKKERTRVNVHVIDSTLVLENFDTFELRGIRKLKRYQVRIGMPTLKSLKIEGVSDVNILGFDEESLDVLIDGLGNMDAKNSRTDMLTVRLDGLGHADLRGLESVDARVDIAGAGVVRLTMSGGSLEGSIDGLGVIRYRGPVSGEAIRVDGGGRVVIE